MMHSIKMENSPEGFDVEFCSGYGFVASNKTTTNGSLAYLLRCLKLQGSRESVMAFARGVAKTDDLARQHVALMDNKPYGSTKPTDDELTARARAVFDKWSRPAHSGEPVECDCRNPYSHDECTQMCGLQDQNEAITQSTPSPPRECRRGGNTGREPNGLFAWLDGNEHGITSN